MRVEREGGALAGGTSLNIGTEISRNFQGDLSVTCAVVGPRVRVYIGILLCSKNISKTLAKASPPIGN